MSGKRSLNLQKTDFRIVREARDTAVFQRASREVLGQIETRPVVGGQERNSDGVRAGFDGDGDFQAASGVSIRSRVATLKIVPLEEPHAFAIDIQLELLVSDIGTENELLEREFILAVRWKNVAHHHAPARTERLALDVVFLRGIARGDIGSFRRCLPIADGHARDLSSCVGIGFQQRRR